LVVREDRTVLPEATNLSHDFALGRIQDGPLSQLVSRMDFRFVGARTLVSSHVNGETSESRGYTREAAIRPNSVTPQRTRNDRIAASDTAEQSGDAAKS
jgi:hypothetical protein